jgi:hypothetical protein
MQSEMELGVDQRLPLQAAPVMRTVVNSAVSGDVGVEASDNDHNTDTERDMFFIRMA